MLVSRRQWQDAYDIAKKKLLLEEYEWLEEVRLSCEADNSPVKAAEEARLEMEKKQWISRETMEKILTPLDKYARVVDTAMQHNPEITYVFFLLALKHIHTGGPGS
jgi:hypothetical protein